MTPKLSNRQEHLLFELLAIAICAVVVFGGFGLLIWLAKAFEVL